MTNASIAKSFFLLLLSVAATGCNEIAQVVTPTCSDEATLALVRKIMSENIADADHQLSPEELKKRLALTLVHATKLEENIRKYTCEATLVASDGTAEHKMSLEYESQLDDAHDHLVQILNLTNDDAYAMKPILAAAAPAAPAAPVASAQTQKQTATEQTPSAAEVPDTNQDSAAANSDDASENEGATDNNTVGHATVGGAIKQPTGWDVQYQDTNCVVFTKASGSENEPEWSIKMGYLSGNQLIFMFSASNSALHDLQFPKNTKAWLIVDGKDFEAIGISNKSGELIAPVENGLKLQKALDSAKSLEIQVQVPQSNKRISAAEFELDNIPGAMEWLRSCTVMGVGALPR